MEKFFILVFFLPFPAAFCGEPDSLIQFLPDNKIISALSASGTEHRISYNKFFEKGLFVGSMGGRFPIANFYLNNWMCQISAASSIYTTLENAGVKYNVTNVDFYVDVDFDIPLYQETIIRSGWGHTSHHLVDDAIAEGRTAINYARDFYKIFLFQNFPGSNGFVYGGITWTYSFLINKNIGRKIMPEVGGDITLFSFNANSALYAAADIKFRGELNYASTQSCQAGIKIQNKTLRAVKIAYTFRTGAEERGQFYNERIQYQTLGIFFDL